jgi:hypothetical protein
MKFYSDNIGTGVFNIILPQNFIFRHNVCHEKICEIVTNLLFL